MATAKILRLGDFDRARAQARRSRVRRKTRFAGAMLVGLAVGGVLVGLFYLGMQWLTNFLGRGTVWRQ